MNKFTLQYKMVTESEVPKEALHIYSAMHDKSLQVSRKTNESPRDFHDRAHSEFRKKFCNHDVCYLKATAMDWNDKSKKYVMVEQSDSEFNTLYENIKMLLEAGQGIVPTNLKVISKSPYAIVMETTSANGTIVKIELGGAMSPTLSFSTKLIVDYDEDGNPVYTDWDHAPPEATIKAASEAANSKGLPTGGSVDGIIWIMTNAFNESGYTGSGTPSDEVKAAMEQARSVVKGFDYFTFFGNPDDKDAQRNADLTRRTKLYMYVLSRTEVIMKNWVSIYNEKKHMYYFRRGTAIHTVLQMYSDMEFMFNSESKVIHALDQLLDQSEPITDSDLTLVKEIDNEQITKWFDQNSRNAAAAKNG